MQPVPANHPPAVWIRRVDHALFAGLTVWVALDFLFAWIAWRSFGAAYPVPDGSLFNQVMGYPSLMLSQITHGHFFRFAAVDNPAAFTLLALHCRLFPSWLLSLLAGAWVFKQALEPWRRMRWIEGPQLLEGKEAMDAAQRFALAECKGQPPFMHLMPGIGFPKSRWTRGVLLYGSPGSGKTVALIPIIQQLIRDNHRGFFYDVKGDFTSYFFGGTVGLVCPWDKRSLVWEIGRDVVSPSQAKAFTSSLIPDAEGEGRFWTSAAQQLMEGTLISLQNELGTNWGWDTLSERMAVDAELFAVRLEKHMPMAAILINDPKSSTTNNILASLVGYTKIIHDLALAWGDGRNNAGQIRPSISFSEWAKDGYDGKLRQIIFQAGPDKSMTTAIGSAILNVLTPELLSAAMPDDEQGRTIAFVLDEMPSLGGIPFQAIVERGRSKGLILVAACQTLDQIEKVWGKETARSLGSMMGTHLIFRVQPSASRDAICDQFGKARWSVTAVSTSDSGASTSVHEENRSVLQPHELSELGPVTGKRFPLGWGIDALVSCGADVWRLSFPGVSPEKKRTPHRPAKWTRGPADAGNHAPEPSRVARLREREDNASNKQLAWNDAMTTDEIAHRKAKAARKAKHMEQNQADPFVDAPLEAAHTHGRLPDEPTVPPAVERIPNRIKEARKRILEEAAPFAPPPFSP